MSLSTLNLVREAHKAGAVTRKEITKFTSLDADIVDLCVDLLIESGEIKPTELKGACTVGGCSSCGEDSTCHPRENNELPVMLNITKRPGI